VGTRIRARLVKIGNSQGIRIPRTLLEQVGLGDEVELEVQDAQLVIRPATHPRAAWDAAFREMAERGDDALIDAEDLRPTDWDETEWQW
jgi:antitoxin MazE